MNFDREIMKLIRESKCLHRLGIEVPDSANMVLLQEQKFKEYYAELTCAAAQTLIFIIIIVTLLASMAFRLSLRLPFRVLFVV